MTERAVTLYRKALDLVIPVDSMEIAKLAKLFENIFRAVNIAALVDRDESPLRSNGR